MHPRTDFLLRSPFLLPYSTPCEMNPNTQEWRATPHITFDHTWQLAPVFLPLPPPAILLVPFAAAPPRVPYYYFYGTVPNNQFGYYNTSTYPPQNDNDVRLHEVARPFSGGSTAAAGTEITDAGESSLERRYAEEGESSMVIKSSNNIKQKRWTTCRKEWRLKKDKKFDNVVAGSGSGAASHGTTKTTIMIKNIPNKLRRDNMLEFLDSRLQKKKEFLDCDDLIAYDFFYLPMDFRTGDNFGYAFVNFTNSDSALKMRSVLHEHIWGEYQTHRGSFRSKKSCFITWADIQGKERLVERYQNSIFGCDNLEFLPVTFDPPRNGSDPKPDPIILGRLRK